MFCPNCGYNVPDTERFCPNCGTMLQQEVAAVPVYGQQQNRGSSIKRLLPFIIGALVLVVAVVVVLVLLLGGGPKSVAEKYIKAEFTGDYATLDKYAAVTREAQLSYYAEEIYDMDLAEYLEINHDVESIEEYYVEMQDEQINELEEEFGSDYKLTVDVQDSEKLDADDFDDLLEEIEEDYEDSKLIDPNKVTAAYEVKVKCRVEGSEDNESATLEVTVIKLNGKWKVYDYVEK